jgi:ParB family chromosome partitioning protein
MSDTTVKTKKDFKKPALGRGLSALLSDNLVDNLSPQPDNNNNNNQRIGEIEISQIETNPYQPRTHFDLVALEELAASITEHGVIQPVTVREITPGKYQLISGERRFQASQLAGKTSIPAYIRTADNEQMLEMALIENIQRENLNPIEVSLGFKRLIDECKLPMEKVGEKVGKNRATVNNYLRLLKLPPEIQIGLRDKLITMGHARAIINVEDPVQQLTLYKDIIANDFSVRKVEELVRDIHQPPAPKKNFTTPTPQTPISSREIHIQALEKEITNQLGVRVKIVEQSAGKGEIKIQFSSEEEFDQLMDLLK